MKAIKYILSTVLLIAVVWSCTEDDFGNTDFVSTAVAPTNVAALFKTTQDNTGLVSIAPSAEGAVLFDINYGDGTTDLGKVNVGEIATHTYEEGNYTVNIVAKGLTGLKTEFTKDLLVSFEPPKFVTDPIIYNDLAVSRKVNVEVKPDAEFAMFFDAVFVEDGFETIVSGNVGETVSYTYANPGIVDIKVVLKGGAIETVEYLLEGFEVTEILAPLASAPTPGGRVEADYYSIFSGSYIDIEGSDYNPGWGQETGYNLFDLEGDEMLQYTTLNYQGIQIGETIDVTAMEYLHVDIWTPKDLASVDIYPLQVGVGAEDEKFKTLDLVEGEWSSFDIPLSFFTDQGLAMDQIHQFKFVGENSGTIFVDNLYFWKEPSELLEFPVDFESETMTYPWEGFGNSDWGPIPVAVIDNPHKSGMNHSSKVTEISKPAGAQTWAGANMAFTNSLDFSKGTTVTMKVWSPRAGVPILFKVEVPGEGNPTAEVEAITTVANQWEEISFDMTTSEVGDFSPSNNYEKIVIFPDMNSSGAGEIFYFDDIEIASVKFPLNFEIETLAYPWEGFGNSDWGAIPVAIVDNPNKTGINLSEKVTEISKPDGAQTWAGANMSFTVPLDFTNGTIVKMKVWSPRAGVPILFKLEVPGDGNPTAEVEATTTVANQWEELSFDMTTSEVGDFSSMIEYEKIVIFPDMNSNGAGEVFYFDDIYVTK